MTHSPSDSRPPRPEACPELRRRAEYRWTNRKAHAFLDALACRGQVAEAARAVGMTRQSAYRLRARVPVVAQAWARAQAIGRERRLGSAAISPAEGDTSGNRPW